MSAILLVYATTLFRMEEIRGEFENLLRRCGSFTDSDFFVNPLPAHRFRPSDPKPGRVTIMNGLGTYDNSGKDYPTVDVAYQFVARVTPVAAPVTAQVSTTEEPAAARVRLPGCTCTAVL